MTDFITEEMVEKAARAAWDRRYGNLADGEFDSWKEAYRNDARAALIAALPLIVERIAGFAAGYDMDTATAIRSLLPTTTKENEHG